MSRFFGSKIAIKFTQPLIGDVEDDNSTAFTVTGQEPQYVKFPGQILGPLIDGDYQVDKVERMPVRELWEDDFSGAMDGVEAGSAGLTLEMNIAGYGQNAIPTMTSNSTPSGTAKASTEFSSTYAAWNAMDRNNLSYWSNTSGSLPAWLEYEFAEAKVIGKYSVRGRSDAGDGSPKAWELQAWDGEKWITLDSQSNQTGWANGEKREFTCGNTNGYKRYRLYITANNGRATTNISEIELMEPLFEYLSAGSYLIGGVDVTELGNLRLRMEADTPDGISIRVEYAYTDDESTEPETWTVAEDQDVLNIDDEYLWLRYTLETKDETVTPTITKVWLEEPSAPVGTILLTMKDLKRFRNVGGDLTVKYDHTKGTLAGAGGPVQSFEEDFMPEGLWRLPNPYVEEKIKVSLVNYKLELNAIQQIVVGDGPYPTEDIRHQKFKQDWPAEKISVSLTTFSLVLTHVNDLDV